MVIGTHVTIELSHLVENLFAETKNNKLHWKIPTRDPSLRFAAAY